MQRRDFVKMLSGLGLGLACPFDLRAASGETKKANQNGVSPFYSDVFYMDIIAHGGLDSSLLTDPKLGTARDPGNNNLPFDTRINPCYTELTSAGNIVYPVIDGVTTWSDFFDAHYNKLTVLNGVDASSTSHLFGMKAAGGGMMTRKYPALAALHAASQTLKNGEVPIPFLSAGTDYDVDRGIIAKTTLTYGEYSKLQDLSDPNHENYHDEDVYAEIMAASQARLSRMLSNPELLGRSRKNAQNLHKGRLANKALGDLWSLYAGRPSLTGVSSSSINFKKTIRMALCAYKLDICYAASLRHGGFDNHGDYKVNHQNRVEELLDGLNFLFAEASDLGILQRVSFQLFSEFSRNPWMNDGDKTEETGGKSHWRATSNAMIYHPNLIGDRVVGLSDVDGYYSANFNEAGELGFSNTSDAVTETCEALNLGMGDSYSQPLARFGIHQELRDLLQIDEGLGEKFPLDAWNYNLLQRSVGVQNQPNEVR